MQIDADDIIKNAYNFIERNSYLLKYQDLTLFDHQKQLFQLFDSDEQVSPKLVLYTAPTGTGEVVRIVGYKISGTIIYFNPSPDYIVLS